MSGNEIVALVNKLIALPTISAKNLINIILDGLMTRLLGIDGFINSLATRSVGFTSTGELIP